MEDIEIQLDKQIYGIVDARFQITQVSYLLAMTRYKLSFQVNVLTAAAPLVGNV